MRAVGGKSDFEDAVRAAPRVKHRAPPSLAVRVDQLADRRSEPRLLQRLDHEVAFPVAVAREIPVLRLAAAAHGKMRAHRRDTLRAFILDAQEMAPVRVAGKR